MDKKYEIGGEALSHMVDIENILLMNRYAGGHDDQMRGLIDGAEVLVHYNEGGYQGSVATCIKLPDNRVAIYNDYYGSCSGCDAWEDASDDEVKKMCHELAFGAYVFQNIEDVVEFLEGLSSGNEPEHYGWRSCAGDLLSDIKFNQ